jgi:hypothetical protein
MIAKRMDQEGDELHKLLEQDEFREAILLKKSEID